MILALHGRVLAGNYAVGAGQFARGARWIRNDQTGETVFEPARAEDVPELVDRMCDRLEHATDEHPAARAAWVHLATAAIHPFRDGNGRCARVLASLAMYRGGFTMPEFTSLEEWWGHRLSDYYGAFRCLGDRFDATRDVTLFIETHVRAQLSQVRARMQREAVERDIWTEIENVSQARYRCRAASRTRCRMRSSVGRSPPATTARSLT